MRTVLHDIILNDDDEELNDFFKDPSNKRMINEPDAIGWTPLHWACSKGLKNSVSALLENGADPNKGTDYDGWTPAHDAARCGNSEILEMLAKAGANIETTTSSGVSPCKPPRAFCLTGAATKAHGRCTMPCSTGARKRCSGCARRDAMWMHPTWLDGLHCTSPFGMAGCTLPTCSWI